MVNYLSYDIEVFPNSFIIDFFSPQNTTHTTFAFHADKENGENYKKLQEFINEVNINRTDLVSFNGLGYDRFVLSSFLTGGIASAWEKSCELTAKRHYLRCYQVFTNCTEYDLYQILPKTAGSLKKIQARLGLPIVTWRDFGKDLPYAQLEACIKYCQNDTQTTSVVFENDIVKKYVNVRKWLKSSAKYGKYINDVSLQDAVLGAKIVSGYMTNGDTRRCRDSLSPVTDFLGEDIFFVDIGNWYYIHTDNYVKVLNAIKKHRFNYKIVADAANKMSYESETPFSLEIPLESNPHFSLRFGEGGLHLHGNTGFFKGEIYNLDVSSQYPSIVKNHAITPNYRDGVYMQKFREVYSRLVNERLQAKKNGDKIKADALKIPINAVIGQFRNPSSLFGDVKAHVEVVIRAQLSILSLIQYLEDLKCGSILHVNTDGVVVKINNDAEKSALEMAMQNWQSQTQLVLEKTLCDAALIIDTNNYAFFQNGKCIKGVGLTNREVSALAGGTEPQIIGDAVKAYFLQGTPPEIFIDSAVKVGDIKPFLFIRQVSANLEHAGIYRYVIANADFPNAVIPPASTLAAYGQKIYICNSELPQNTDSVNTTAYVDLVRRKLEQINIARADTEYLQSILSLRENGLNIIPIKKRYKTPLVEWARWQTESITEAEIRKYWATTRNVGIVCGEISGVTVVDIDDAELGQSILDKLPNNLPAVRTGRGYHLYFRYTGETSRVIAKHVELKANGTYVIAPPSIHNSGVAYTWLRPFNRDALISIPDWLLNVDAVETRKRKRKEKLYELNSNEIVEGTRNVVLASKAGKYVADGKPLEEVTKLLLADNASLAKPLPQGEVKAIAKSIVKTDSKHTRERVKDLRLSDYEIMKRFAEYLKDLRFCKSRDAWYQRNCTKWVELPNNHEVKTRFNIMTEDATNLLMQNPEDKELLKYVNELHKTKKMMNVVSRIEDMPSVQIIEERNDENCIYTPNQKISWENSELRVEDYKNETIRNITYTDYNPTAECPTWLKFIDRITCHDKDYAEYLQKLAGYALIPGNPRHEIYVLYGIGCNGKSTFSETLRFILGDYGGSANLISLLGKHESTNPSDYELASIKSKRLVISAEVRESKTLDVEIIKNLTGGEAVRAREIYGKPFSYVPQWKVFIHGNYKPEFSGDDSAIWRRVKLLPFNAVIPAAEVDIDLKNKLIGEAQGIFVWCIRGLYRYLAEGLQPPSVVSDATEIYRDSSGSIDDFVSSLKSSGRIVNHRNMHYELYGTVKDIKYLYHMWCDENGEEPLSVRSFNNRMINRNFTIIVNKMYDKSVRCWAKQTQKKGD